MNYSLEDLEKFVNGHGDVVYYRVEKFWYTANHYLADENNIFEKWKSNIIFPVYSGNYEMVDHPSHYGGADNVYEVIKIIEHFGLCFHLGNLLKYVLRCGKKDDELQELKKARWYLDRKIQNLENGSK